MAKQRTAAELQKQTLELETLYNQHRDKLFETHSELKQKLHDERMKEFEKERGLRPIKIFIAGPPCCGKSFYAA